MQSFTWTIPGSLSAWAASVWTISGGFLPAGHWLSVFSCVSKVQHYVIVGLLPKIHQFPCWKHPKITCVFVFFFTGRNWQSLYYVESMSPFKFTYKKELTLVQTLALQNAPGKHSIWTGTSACLTHDPSSWCFSHWPDHSWPAGHPTHTPTGHSKDAAVEWGFSAKVAKGLHCQLVASKSLHPFCLAYPVTCLPSLVHELRKESCNGPEGEGWLLWEEAKTRLGKNIIFQRKRTWTGDVELGLF